MTRHSLSGFFGKVPREVLRDGNLPDRAVRLYGLLADIANPKPTAFAGRNELARLMSCSPSKVDSALAALVDQGWIRREARYRPDGGRTSDLITLTPLVNSEEGGQQNRPGGLVSSTETPSLELTRQEGEPREAEPGEGTTPGADAPARDRCCASTDPDDHMVACVRWYFEQHPDIDRQLFDEIDEWEIDARLENSHPVLVAAWYADDIRKRVASSQPIRATATTRDRRPTRSAK